MFVKWCKTTIRKKRLKRLIKITHPQNRGGEPYTEERKNMLQIKIRDMYYSKIITQLPN